MQKSLFIAVVIASACTGNDQREDVKQIEVSQYNTFGITRMTARHFTNADSNLFELRAYTQANAEVALVRLRVGPVAGIVAGESVEGAETLVSVQSMQMTQKSSEHWTIVIDADQAPDPGIKTFLFLSFVRDALKQEADIIVQGTPQATTNTGFVIDQCPTDWLLTAPLAKQCCALGYSKDYEDAEIPQLRDLSPAPTLSASQNSSTAYQAMDASYTTRWTTGVPQANGQYIKVSASACTYIDSIYLDQGTSTNDYPRGYAVYLSLDGTNWGTPVATGAGTAGSTSIYFNPTAGKYIKIVQTGSAGAWWSIHDMQITYTEVCNEVPRTDPNNGISWVTTGYNAAGQLKTGGYQGSNATDGTMNTHFSTQETQRPNERLQVSFGYCEAVDRIVMDTTPWPNEYPRGYSVYLSMDGINWGSPVYSGVGTSPITDTGLFTRTNAKYLKIVQTATNTTYWWSIGELHVYGHPCYEYPGLPWHPSTHFVRATDGALVQRDRNYAGQTCIGYYDEPCTGASCYFGPNGFSRPYIVNAEDVATLDYGAYWRVDEIAGTVAWDASQDYNPYFQNPTPMTLYNGAAFVAGGHLTSAIQLDGIDDYAANTNADVNTWAFSAYGISAWINMPTGTTTTGDVLSMADNWGLRVYNDGNVKSWFYDSATTYKMATTTGLNLHDGLWHHLVGTYNGSSIQIYVDGVLKATLAATGQIQYVRGGKSLYIGTNGFVTGKIFKGKIDEVRVFTHALTSTDVSVLFGSKKYYYNIGYYGACYGSIQDTPVTTGLYPDTTGTAPRGQGCPSGSSLPNTLGFWDY